jgi:hypothetical protein
MALVKYNNNSISAITSAASIPSGALTHIKTLTADGSATLSFVDGSSSVVLDNTYPIYMFKFINMHPATDGVAFQFNLSADSGSNYNVTKTTTNFGAFQDEAGSQTNLGYDSDRDLAQSTDFQTFFSNGIMGNGNDESTSGQLMLFSPSSTTFVKHFMSVVNYYNYGDYTINSYVGGYGNTTSAIDAIQFKMNSGNIDSGTIKLYGIKDS